MSFLAVSLPEPKTNRGGTIMVRKPMNGTFATPLNPERILLALARICAAREGCEVTEATVYRTGAKET